MTRNLTTWMLSRPSPNSQQESPELPVELVSWRWRLSFLGLIRIPVPSFHCQKRLTCTLQVHALLDQFKKFSGVVKQMGGVKELFKDEKQVKNLNPQKMGKVCNSINLFKMASHPLIPLSS